MMSSKKFYTDVAMLRRESFSAFHKFDVSQILLLETTVASEIGARTE